MSARWCACVAASALAACSQVSPSGTVAPSQVQSIAVPAVRGARLAPAQALHGPSPYSRIHHVVIVVQENRTTDNLFNGLPGADTVRSAQGPSGSIPLAPVSLTAPYDLSHRHAAFVTEYAGGAMNGFTKETSTCDASSACPPSDRRAFGYVPRYEVEPYFDMAEQYTFADRMFQTNEGPSFPAHQYIISGTSAIAEDSPLLAAENALTPTGDSTGGCDAPAGSTVDVIDQNGKEDQKVFPCFDRAALPDLIRARSLTWRYYESHVGAGLWEAPDAIVSLRTSPDYFVNVVAPETQVLRDVRQGTLANVVWVTPTKDASDHAGSNDGTGPSWVASIVNTIGESRYWNDTAIFVTWDDWGGWYDHVKPPQYNSYELGFRVPLIVISPYAKRHYVSHKQHEFGSILKFAEEVFGLGSLDTTDVRADDLSDCFDFSQRPARFRPIKARYPAAYFLKQPISTADPDDDN